MPARESRPGWTELPGEAGLYQAQVRPLAQGGYLCDSASDPCYRPVLADCLPWMAERPPNSVHAIMSDPPADLILRERVSRQDRWLRVRLSTAHRFLLRLLFGLSIPDAKIPFRLIRAPVLGRRLAAIPPAAFAPNVLLSLLPGREGCLLAGVPVRHFPRPGGSPSVRGGRILRIGLRRLRQLKAFRRYLG